MSYLGEVPGDTLEHVANKHSNVMRSYQYEQFEGIDSLTAAWLPIPKPGPGQVLVRIHAVSLNYKDLFIARGIPSRADSGPLIPLSDGAGEVVEAGSGVTRVKAGDRVAGLVAQDWITGRLTEGIRESVLGTAISGVLAEYVILKAEGVVRFPPHLSYEEASTLPCAAATAWNALAGVGSVKAGDTVLVQGSGGVSVFALQFAKVLGARVIAISSSDDKLKRLRELGAFAGVNYKSTPDWGEEVLGITEGAGVDHVVEVGGAGTLAQSLWAVRTEGTISLIGALAGVEGTINPLTVLLKGVRLQGLSVGPRDVFEEMNRAIQKHKLRPIVDRVFPFEQAKEAMRYLESGKHFGKIVIRL
jgi:NADPH:quinone reductase-like Zn-dependent oxidoreductase